MRVCLTAFMNMRAGSKEVRGAGVIVSCELLDMVLGTELGSSASVPLNG